MYGTSVFTLTNSTEVVAKNDKTILIGDFPRGNSKPDKSL